MTKDEAIEVERKLFEADGFAQQLGVTFDEWRKRYIVASEVSASPVPLASGNTNNNTEGK